MILELFIRGIVIGLVASITLGPVGVMCIQRTLSKSRKAGFLSGLGAATADSIFATIAYFFISLVSAFIEENMNVISIIGGLCVIFVGVRIYLTNPIVQIRRNRAGKSNLWQDYISTFFLTLTNPAFILWLIVIFTAFNVSYDPEAPDDISRVVSGLFMIFGFFVGAATWWFSLTYSINLLRNRFKPRHLLWINRIAGSIISILGASAIVVTIIKMLE